MEPYIGCRRPLAPGWLRCRLPCPREAPTRHCGCGARAGLWRPLSHRIARLPEHCWLEHRDGRECYGEADSKLEEASGSTVKRAFSRLLQLLLSMRLRGVATLALSSLVSVLDKRLTLARWDGEDWEFKWSDGCLYWSSHQVRPRLVTTNNIGTFLMFYRPKFGDTVLEVGAGSGTEVCSLSNMVGPTGRVIAIEADPSAARQLRKQARGLRFNNVTVVEFAVGEFSGEVQLHITGPSGVANSTAAVVGGSCVNVRSTTLRDVMAELGVDKVAYMKMNIEGAEYDALRGFGPAIKNVEEMVVSCHDFTGDPAQATYKKVYDYLGSWDFRVKNVANPRNRWEEFYIFASSV